jgi:hypothetical protein
MANGRPPCVVCYSLQATLNIEVTGWYKISVITYHSTRNCVPEDLNFHHHSENKKSA